MKIVFLDAISMGDASLAEIAALGEFVCYPSSTPEEARAFAVNARKNGFGAIIVGVHMGGDGVDRLFNLFPRDEGFENLVVKFDSVFHGVLVLATQK